MSNMNFGTRKYRFEIARQALVNGVIEYHGRNCVLLVEIAGVKDDKSHMIMDLGDLDDAINTIIDDYDHTTITYTFEYLTLVLFQRIRRAFDNVWKITLYEDDNTYYELKRHIIVGDTEEINASKGYAHMNITKGYDFTAAHRTHNPKLSAEENEYVYGKCNTLHGHQYRLEVTVSAEFDRDTGVLIDQKHMNVQVLGVISKYHNKIINEVLNDNPDVPTSNATTENFIEVLWDQLYPRLDGEYYKLSKLRLHETDRNYFDYFGSE